MPSRRLAEHVRPRSPLQCSARSTSWKSSGVSRRAGRFRAHQPRSRQRVDQADEHGRAGVELRNLARIPGRGHGRSRASPPEDHAAARPHRIGDGSGDWKRVARMTLDTAARFPDVGIVNLGGGFKVGRMPEEPSTEPGGCRRPRPPRARGFPRARRRALHLEIEPGTFLVANAGAIVASASTSWTRAPTGTSSGSSTRACRR